MKAPSTALLRTFSPLWRSEAPLATVRGCLAQQQQQHQRADFSSTPANQARDKRQKKDPKIAQIRYHLQHPLTPRPLRFSRNRALRHWTIHRAWQLYQAKQRTQHQLDLERQYNSMATACEALRLIDTRGLTAAERLKLGEPEAEGQQIGKLYRLAMQKKGIWEGVPIEYARIQTDTPPKDGWNHGWTR